MACGTLDKYLIGWAGVGQVGGTWALFCLYEIRSDFETKNGKVKQAPGCVGLELR